MNEAGRGVDERITYAELIELPGIGPYAAGHVAMLLHDYSRIPVDSAVARFFRERYELAPDQIEPFFDKWGDYRFLGYRLSAR
jgi:endonuclease III